MSTIDVQTMNQAGMETKFVTGDEFCRLITSRRQLERWDDHALGLRGLLDSASAIRWVIHERQLQASPIVPSTPRDPVS
jgi:hypothetical protein